MAASTSIDATMEDGMFVDKYQKAENRLTQNPYDTEAWSIVLQKVQTKKIEEARPHYEKLVGVFVNSGRYWKIYIEHEMKTKNYDKVEKRCLVKVLNIELWKLYLTYIKETKSSLPTYREKMAQAYDFALEKIGMDYMSYQIWADYVAFLKSVEAVGSYAENQKISAVRKVYQRGIGNMMLNVELFWRDYCSFEQAINPIIAKKMQDDRNRDFVKAQRSATYYDKNFKDLNKNNPSIPPQNTPEELRQLDLWRKYIEWEKGNPLGTTETRVIIDRVMFAYEQCILCFALHPGVWIEAATYLEQMSKQISEKGVDNSGKSLAEESAAVYERATTTTLKRCMLVYFAYADFEESRLKHDKVHSIYKRLLEVTDIDPTLVYIQYMRFTRRVEGIKSARLVFKAAREDSRAKFHVYIAAALMEYYSSKDSSIAFKIFELALKKYGGEIDFVREYIDYLSHINEDNNTRVLFERILTSGQLPANKTLEVYNKFLDFEVNIGDLTGVLKVEKRRLVALNAERGGDVKEATVMVNRYKYLDLLPCQPAELTALGYRVWRTLTVPVASKSSVPAAVLPAAVAAAPVNGNASSSLDKKEVVEQLPTQKKFPRPDFNMMLPYKPKRIVPFDSHPIPGGVFPVPPAAADLLSKMPPPQCFHGPFVMVDKLMEYLSTVQLSEEMFKYEHGSIDPRASDKGTQLSIDIALGRKRKIENRGGGDSDEEGVGVAPPSNDIYRLRQQKKLK